MPRGSKTIPGREIEKKTVVDSLTLEKETSEIIHSCVSPRQGCLLFEVNCPYEMYVGDFPGESPSCSTRVHFLVRRLQKRFYSHATHCTFVVMVAFRRLTCMH